MKYKTLEIVVRHGVSVIWMNRPDLRNAFNETMIAELTQAFKAADADKNLRAVVLAGHGPAFCAGADLNWMKKMSGYNLRENHADAMGLAARLPALSIPFHSTPSPWRTESSVVGSEARMPSTPAPTSCW